MDDANGHLAPAGLLAVPVPCISHVPTRKRRRVKVRDDVIPKLYGLAAAAAVQPRAAPTVGPPHDPVAVAVAETCTAPLAPTPLAPPFGNGATAATMPPAQMHVHDLGSRPPGSAPSLLEHLNELFPQEDNGGGGGACSILHPDDGTELVALLTESIAVTEAAAPSSPKRGGCHRSLHEVLMRVLEALFQRDGRPSHVLSFGYKLAADSGALGAAPVAGHPSISCLYPNPAMTYLKRKPWATLHSRLGDAATIHLLLHTSIFVEIDPASPLGNFIQVTGTLAASRLVRPVAPARHGAVPQAHFVQRLLHDISFADRLGAAHPLNMLTRHIKPAEHVSNRSAGKLLYDIFGGGVCFQSSGGKMSGSPKLKSRFTRMLPLARQLLARFRRCNMKALLQHHCTAVDRDLDPAVCAASCGGAPRPIDTVEPLQDTGATTAVPDKTKARVPADTGKPANYNIQFSSCGEVRAFVVAVLNAIVPKELWGCTANRNRIFGKVDSLIRLTRYERFSVDEVLPGLKLNACRWLHAGAANHAPTTEHGVRQSLLQQWVHWLFDSLVVPVIRAHFYVTESCTNKNRLFFYRKPLWKAMHREALTALQAKMYEPVPFHTATRTLEKQKLGFSYIRMVPKATGMRCLVNMSRKSPASAGARAHLFQTSINRNLQNLFQILKFERSRAPEMLGSSVFAMDDVYVKLSAFARSFRDHQSSGTPRQRLYFVSVDVKKCFDSVRHDKLLEIVDGALREDEYVVRKFTTVMMKGGKLQRTYRKHVDVASGAMPHLRELAAACGTPYRNAVLGDQVSVTYETKAGLLALLREHVLGNYVKAGGQFYRQACGIAQGSVLSSMLCSYFYGDLEKKVLRIDADSSGLDLMMRQIDDFLMITTDREAATRFLRTMFEGVEAYGCEISRGKTKTNFEPRRSVVDTGRLLEGSDVATPSSASTTAGSVPVNTDSISTASLESNSSGPQRSINGESAVDADSIDALWMPWCGILVNTATLETRLDMSRYEGTYIRDTITAALAKKPGESVLDKLLFFLKMKLHPLLIDEGLNTKFGASLNLYQIFRLCAMKLHCHVRLLPPKQRVRSNSGFFMRVIGELMHYPQKRIRSVLQNRAFASFRYTLRRAEVSYLAIDAFLATFRPRQTEYLPLIAELETKHDELRGKLPPGQLQLLRRVILAPENDTFKQILI